MLGGHEANARMRRGRAGNRRQGQWEPNYGFSRRVKMKRVDWIEIGWEQRTGPPWKPTRSFINSFLPLLVNLNNASPSFTLMDHYSSLFTMGLLSERASPVSTPSPRSGSFFSKFRKSSLPTKALSKPSEIMYSRGEGRFYPNNDAPPPQFTNPFGDSPNTTNEPCSFLSLDLAADGTSNPRRSSTYLFPLDTDSCPPAYSPTLSPYVSIATTTYSTWRS